MSGFDPQPLYFRSHMLCAVHVTLNQMNAEINYLLFFVVIYTFNIEAASELQKDEIVNNNYAMVTQNLSLNNHNQSLFAL